MASGKPLPFVADSVRVLSMVTPPPEIGVAGGARCGDGPTYNDRRRQGCVGSLELYFGRLSGGPQGQSVASKERLSGKHDYLLSASRAEALKRKSWIS